MAVGEKQPNKLVLKLDGAVNSKQFVDAVTNFFRILTNVSDSATQTNDAIEWFVEVDKGSAIIEAKASPKNIPIDRIPVALEAIDFGLRLLEKGEEKIRPTNFNDTAMRAAKSLGQLIEKDIFVSVTASWGQILPPETQRLSTQTSASVDSVLEASYTDYGTIEGALETVSARKGYKFSIYDDLTNSAIKCHFKPEILEDVLKAFEQRISVWGQINYRKDGLPISIQVDGFRVFRKAEDLPTIESMIGLLGGAA